MLLHLVALAACDDICTSVYGSNCSLCLAHFADRHCAFDPKAGICKDVTQGSGDIPVIYGPQANCSSSPALVKPSPAAPTPVPKPSFDGCQQFAGCEACTLHYADRNCGYCQTSNQCVNGASANCTAEHFYYANNAKCQATIPPSTTPWPRYQANPTFCYDMTDSNCKKCVKSNVSMQCGWCHKTGECIMGDNKGPYFGTCGDWSIESDSSSMGHCSGELSKQAILGMAIGIPIAVIVIIVAIIVTLRLRKKRQGRDKQSYEEVGH